MTKRHISILDQARAIQAERGENYGGIEDNFTNIADLLNVIVPLREHRFDPWFVAMALAAVKMARIRGNQRHQDNYVDAINYLAFAAHFAEQDEQAHFEAFDVTPDELPDGLRAAYDMLDSMFPGRVRATKMRRS